MSRLIWDAINERRYETGVNQGVVYPMNDAGVYPLGIAWNGLTAVTESPSGAEPNPIYADNIKYLNLISNEEFGATVEAYIYPDEFAICDGSAALTTGVYIGQQKRKGFGLCYKTIIGNDTEGGDYGYKIHLIYNANAAPSEKAYATVNDSPEAITFSWEITTTPVPVTGFKPTASLTIDSTKVSFAKLEQLENVLYGTDGIDARLPLPEEVLAIMSGEIPEAIALSSIVPEDEANNIAVDADIVITFNNEIYAESIVVTSAAGDIVVGTKTWDVTGKALTFHPTSNLTESVTYIVTISGVSDIYGQVLDASVTNFTTVAG